MGDPCLNRCKIFFCIPGVQMYQETFILAIAESNADGFKENQVSWRILAGSVHYKHVRAVHLSTRFLRKKHAKCPNKTRRATRISDQQSCALSDCFQHLKREIKCVGSSSRGVASDRCRCISALCVKYWDPASLVVTGFRLAESTYRQSLKLAMPV